MQRTKVCCKYRSDSFFLARACSRKIATHSLLWLTLDVVGVCPIQEKKIAQNLSNLRVLYIIIFNEILV